MSTVAGVSCNVANTNTIPHLATIFNSTVSLQFITIFANNTAAGEVTRVEGGNEITSWFTELGKWTGAGEWSTHFICISLYSIMLYRNVQGSGTPDCEFSLS
jgi:hypothetical protein